MTHSAEYWDRHAVKYAASPIKDLESYEYTLSRTRSYLDRHSTVLEIGCGTGSTALLLAGDVGRIEGTDVSPRMLRIARDKARESDQNNVHFRVATAQQAVSGASGFDAVLAFNLFHLTQNAERIFRTLHDALPPGGLFISKTPCLAEPSIGPKRFALAAMIPVMRLIGLAPFVRRFSFAELETAIVAAGFEVIETGSFPAMSRYIVARKRKD